jgi:hypothetical protein
MDEITITFSAEELIEVAKAIYLATNILTQNDYENKELLHEIDGRICKAGFHLAPETGAFYPGGFTENEFRLNNELAEECDVLVENYDAEVFTNSVAYDLADRDFQEKYGKMDALIVVNNPKLLNEIQAMQKLYIKEIETYGVTHLRLEKKRSVKKSSKSNNLK